MGVVSSGRSGRALMALVMSVASAVSTGETPGRPPRLSADQLPEPPMQRAAWTPPKGDWPDAWAAAAAPLFDHGLADPRGCAYRTITVTVGSVWGGGTAVACHGWVLPAKHASGPRYAVCWNGLVYPVASVGGPADLAADVEQLIKADEAARAEWAKDRPDFPFLGIHRDCPPEASGVSEQVVLPLKACLLLRLDRGDLARRVWNAWTGPAPADAPAPAADPYLSWASAWLWSLFDRSVCAHMRADDRLARAGLDLLASARPAVEREMAGRKIETPREKPFDYLDVASSLSADNTRRLKQPARSTALKRGRIAFPTQAAWVAALVDDLDQVNARQSGQPGGVELGSDPIVVALIDCGDDAVEPLLDCLEHDPRLTRSVHFWRDFAPNRQPIGVAEAAYVALNGILKTSFFETASTGDDLSSRGENGRQRTAAAIRAYWTKYRGLSLPERWYAVLADDHASVNAWMQAVGNILRPTDVEVTPGSMFGTGWVSVPDRAPGEKPRLSGEELRAKRQPSVTDLFIKRIGQLAAEKPDDGWKWSNSVNAANRLAVGLMEWDPAAARPVLLDRLKASVSLYSDPAFQTRRESLVDDIAGMATLLADAGERSALKTYGDWLRGVEPDKIGTYPEKVLSPLWRYENDPAIAATNKWLFSNPASPWNPMLNKVSIGWGHDRLLTSPLLGIAAVREQVLRGLADESTYAELLMLENHQYEMKYGQGSSRTGVPSGDDSAVPAGSREQIRTQDRYAKVLSKLRGAPAFEFYWPAARRAEAVAACAAFLRQYGERLKYAPGLIPDPDQFMDEQRARLTFPALDHPATPQDVTALRAIFTLDGKGERRQVKLPAWPMRAKWVTLKKYPFDQQYYSPKEKKAGVRREYDQTCWVWQAEELEVNGEWKRFYGVVGPHEVAMVPAEELRVAIEANQWTPLSDGLEVRIEMPQPVPGPDGQPGRLTRSSPLVARVLVRNRLGVPAEIPTRLLASDDIGVSAAPGIRLSLRHPPEPTGGDAADSEGVTQRPLLPVRPLRTLQSKWAEAGEVSPAGEIDLQSLFDFPRPGVYMLSLSFTPQSGYDAVTTVMFFDLK